jgi:hypothetical protein
MTDPVRVLCNHSYGLRLRLFHLGVPVGKPVLADEITRELVGSQAAPISQIAQYCDRR